MSINNYGTDQEYTDLINFLIEETRNVKAPMNYRHLVEKFKEESNAPQNTHCLRVRILRARSRILKLQDIDTVAKAKLFFALGYSVDTDFLNELITLADVTLDAQQRIIEHKTRGGGLALSGGYGGYFQEESHKTIEQGEQILKFLAQKSRETSVPVDASTLMKEFKQATGSVNKIRVLRTRYRPLKHQIFDTEFDKETKVRMMFVSSAKLDDYVLKKLRKEALVEVDDQNRITKYVHENLHLEGVHKQEATNANKRRRESASDDSGGEENDDCGRVSKKRTMDTNFFQYGNSSEPVQLTEPKQEVMEAAAKVEAVEVADSKETTQSEFLEAIHSVILSLDITSLKPIQSKIEAKIQRTNDKPIKNNEILLALSTCVTRMTERSSVRVHTESMSLTHFLCSLKAVVVALKLTRIESFLTDLKQKIGEISVQDKRVPIAEVEGALQAALDVVNI